MKGLKLSLVVALAGVGFVGTAQKSAAQVSINIGVNAPVPVAPVAVAPVAVAPACPYGYFNYAPYGCAPFGYYGPQWFTGGVFIGAGPWFHGPQGFHAYVNHAYDPRFGYHGPYPHKGERPDWGRHVGWEKQFHGNEMREEHWHDNGHHYGQDKDHDHAHDYDRDHDHGHHDDHHDDHGNDHGRGHDHN